MGKIKARDIAFKVKQYSATLLSGGQPVLALVVALPLMGFALLESLLDLCVGCLVYTHLVWPLWGEQP